jgi:hypothetical protein
MGPKSETTSINKLLLQKDLKQALHDVAIYYGPTQWFNYNDIIEKKFNLGSLQV